MLSWLSCDWIYLPHEIPSEKSNFRGPYHFLCEMSGSIISNCRETTNCKSQHFWLKFVYTQLKKWKKFDAKIVVELYQTEESEALCSSRWKKRITVETKVSDPLDVRASKCACVHTCIHLHAGQCNNSPVSGGTTAEGGAQVELWKAKEPE